MSFISIDQNSNPLWDVVPKLHAMTAAGLAGTHCMEDIDVAFTKRGADEKDSRNLGIEAERFYRGGVTDWGATLFYSDFLGQTPIDPRALEIYTGATLKSLGKQLETDVDGIYSMFGGSDNHQLVGSSYIHDNDHHRTIGDLKIKDVKPQLLELLDMAESDVTARFPGKDARIRSNEWFADQSQWLHDEIAKLTEAAPLTALYQAWLQSLIPEKSKNLRITSTSDLFAPGQDNGGIHALLAACLSNHEQFCDAYNTAITTTNEHLTRLKPERGDLPFFTVWRQNGRMFRTECKLDKNQFITPVASAEVDPANPMQAICELRSHGLAAIAGKALVLVLQARSKSGGAALALPEYGSLYMMTAHQLECELRKRKLLTADMHPILRVKLGFLDQLAHSREVIKLPQWLERRINIGEMQAAEFADSYRAWQRQAQTELGLATDKNQRGQLLEQTSPKLSRQIQALETQRRELARNPQTRSRASEVWNQIKPLRKRQMQKFCQRMMDNLHLADLDYWNSRGATLPWAIAAGGKKWYNEHVIKNAKIEKETALTYKKRG